MGQNQSEVDVNDFAVRLTETVEFVHPSISTEVMERVLASTQVHVSHRHNWKAKSTTVGAPVTACFQIPESIVCEAYLGTLFHARHSIQVIAETATDRTTNPRLSCPISLMKQCVQNGQVMTEMERKSCVGIIML